MENIINKLPISMNFINSIFFPNTLGLESCDLFLNINKSYVNEKKSENFQTNINKLLNQQTPKKNIIYLNIPILQSKQLDSNYINFDKNNFNNNNENKKLESNSDKFIQYDKLQNCKQLKNNCNDDYENISNYSDISSNSSKHSGYNDKSKFNKYNDNSSRQSDFDNESKYTNNSSRLSNLEEDFETNFPEITTKLITKTSMQNYLLKKYPELKIKDLKLLAQAKKKETKETKEAVKNAKKIIDRNLKNINRNSKNSHLEENF